MVWDLCGVPCLELIDFQFCGSKRGYRSSCLISNLHEIKAIITHLLAVGGRLSRIPCDPLTHTLWSLEDMIKRILEIFGGFGGSTSASLSMVLHSVGFTGLEWRFLSAPPFCFTFDLELFGSVLLTQNTWTPEFISCRHFFITEILNILLQTKLCEYFRIS